MSLLEEIEKLGFKIKTDYRDLALQTVREDDAARSRKSKSNRRHKINAEENARRKRMRAEAHHDPEIRAKLLAEKSKDRLRDYMRRPFVTIDFEGLKFKGDDRCVDGVVYPAHHLVLGGMAIDSEDELAVRNSGAKTCWLGDGKTPLTPYRTLEWLIECRMKFQGPHKPRPPIFCIFSGNYDFTQILKGPQKGLPFDEFMPRTKAYEIVKQQKYIELDEDGYPEDPDIDEEDIESLRIRGAVFWRDFAIKMIPNKTFYLGLLRDAKNPYVRRIEVYRYTPDGKSEEIIEKKWLPVPEIRSYADGMRAKFKGAHVRLSRKRLDVSASMTIYDVRGFFQSPLTVVIENLAKEDSARLEELRNSGGETSDIAQKTAKLCCLRRRLAIVCRMKALRDRFAEPPEAIRRNFMLRVKAYTRLELQLLARAVGVLRSKLQGMTLRGEVLDLRLKSWCGAGAIAGAVLRKFQMKELHYPEDIETGKRRDPSSGKIIPIPLYQLAAHHAYYGGRIELLKMGYCTNTTLYGYDISSAYPWGMSQFPSMRGGNWEHLKDKQSLVPFNDAKSLKVLRNTVESTCILSMFKLHWWLPIRDGKRPITFFPLPYRTESKTILAPHAGYAWVMRDDILAMIAWLKYFNPTWPKLGRNEVAIFWFEEAFLFHPLDPESRPFSWCADFYQERKRIKSQPFYDLTENVIKLGPLNSVYGKTAQKVGGGYDTPPPGACPHYAAATTAACRRRLIEAAALDPFAIVFFATDGLIAEKPLPLSRLKAKEDCEMGDWESYEINQILAVQSGVYSVSKKHVAKDGTIAWEPATKTRGSDPKKYDPDKTAHEWLVPDTLAAWRAFTYEKFLAFKKAGKPVEKYPEVVLPYSDYVTIGSSVLFRSRYSVCGRWAEKAERLPDGSWGPGAKRGIKAHTPGPKRALHTEEIEEYVSFEGDDPLRCWSLIDTVPLAIVRRNAAGEWERCPMNEIPLSAIRAVDWADFDDIEFNEERDQMAIEDRFR